jgi:hypothetical protein
LDIHTIPNILHTRSLLFLLQSVNADYLAVPEDTLALTEMQPPIPETIEESDHSSNADHDFAPKNN